jgi:hypothetical protein
MRNRSQIGCALLVVALVVSSGVARAQLCFPPAQSVPDWWSPGATPVGTMTTSFLDDPRWNGALSHDVLEYERFRVVIENVGGAQFLVMSWQVKADLNGSGDRLYFGLWDDATNSGNIYRLSRIQSMQTTAAGAMAASGAFSGRVFSGTGPIGNVAWTRVSTVPPPPLPHWLTSDARVDVSCSTPPKTGCDRWAFRIRAPLSATANPADTQPAGFRLTGPNFHFWYEIQDSASLGAAATYAFPPGIVNAHEGGIPPIVFPDPGTWHPARIAAGRTCQSDVSLDISNVWVNAAGSTMMNLTSNEFHAQPTNRTLGVLQNDAITARFRIANWGSVSAASPEWQDTCTSTGTAGAIATGSPFNLGCTWTSFDACAYRLAGDPCGPQAGTKDPHLCVLVDLANATGTVNTLVFSPQSVFRNMDFDTNSVLTRQALIDTRGLPPMANGAEKRDLFLLVQTRNLPARAPRLPAGTSVSGAQPLPGTITASPAAPSATRVPPVNEDVMRVREISALRARFRELQLPSQGAIDLKSSLRIQEAVRKRQITLEQVELLMPTYRVYVWHDTGRMIDTESGPVRVLEPQPSFGLFLAHDGDLEGWEHRFEGAQKVAEGLYKITADVDGVTKVTATIAPKGELPGLRPTVPPAQPATCSRCDVAPRNANTPIAVILTLAFVAFVTLRVRKRRGRS